MAIFMHSVAQVSLATDKHTKRRYAMKEVCLTANGCDPKQTLEEIRVMRKLHHKGLVNLEETFQSPKTLWLVRLLQSEFCLKAIVQARCQQSTKQVRLLNADGGILRRRRADRTSGCP